MKEVEYIDLKQCILEDNINNANEVMKLSREKKFFFWNIMSSPGSGKTTFITEIIRRFEGKYRFGVIEGDVESTVDAQKMQALGVPAVQLRTGGGCHLEANMILKAMESLPLEDLDIVIVENIGNLVCPAEFDLGADLPSMLLSVPEGDDKAIKYPLMFSVCKALMVTKIDALPIFDFDFEALERNTRKLNDDLKIFPLSAKSGEGMEEFCAWLESLVEAKKQELDK